MNEYQKPEGERPPPQKPVTYEETRQFVSDKIGMTPSLRKEDNIFQAKFVGASIFVGIIVMPFVGPAYWDPEAGWRVWVIIGALFGMIGGAFVSGAIIGIRNLRR
ncbi:MAG: hypothetical protein KF784_02795 [Fimbriimonadaceae bacterium]|nr:hypothetical protein [Fimbriimonadaceae bacterium]